MFNMKRIEDIEKAARQVIGVCPDWDVLECFRVGYKEGAKWADETMVEKACNWMKEQVYQEYGGGPLERIIPDTRIEEFRKAMEE